MYAIRSYYAGRVHPPKRRQTLHPHMRIDIHCHAFHPKIADKVTAQLDEHYGIRPVGTGTCEDLLARARRAGLDKVVVLGAATDPSQVIPANNWAIGLQREHPEVA